MHDNPLALKPFNGLKDYVAFFIGRGSYWYRQRKIQEAGELLARHREFIESFPAEQRDKLGQKYAELRGLRQKSMFIAKLEARLDDLRTEQARNVAGKLPQDTLKLIERMPAPQREVMKEYYLKNLYGKDFEKRLEADSLDEMSEAFLQN